MSVESLYQEIILDHYRAKHHSGLREPYDVEVHHVNPSCGDELTLRVSVVGGEVADVSYEGVGCSISQASTSVMSDLVIGGSPARALELHDGFQQMIQGKGEISLDEDTYEDAVAFEGVAKFVGRVKCAMLGWAAVRDALLQATAMEGKS
ncbi:MAG TPA: SUF system NifU family Fe-S cluster assembly protein [Propionibacteriaceae bacterium]|nr:SUF system NifU family Fe-S cluster assembly protein [Propionibacteriaceae bacterium]HPZ50614.1 SUF system NifU family Fe-S cluster assembly protein [Propionibacteriaceae bacterium]